MSSRAPRVIFGCGCPRKEKNGGRGRVSTRTISRNDHCWHQAPSTVLRDKGALQLSLLRCGTPTVVILGCGGGVSYHGRQRPLPTHIYRGNNHRHDFMDCFVIRGEGEPMMIKGVIVVILVVGVV